MKTKKSSPKHIPLPADYPLLMVVMFALIALSLVVMVFYLGALLSFQNNLLSMSPGYNASGSGVIESVNYHTHQLPQEFPAELIRSQQGSFLSSQEMSSEGVGSLKFVSFKSSDTVAALTSYYREFLWRQLFFFSEQADARGISITASRGGASLNVGISPDSSEGSLVAIYYRLTK
ncbi:MAG TPA: hypothetical protein VJK50_04675 [Patescibacteria group bacterium]|nr:hypothetical protein [Patescibacteria group bacterium]